MSILFLLVTLFQITECMGELIFKEFGNPNEQINVGECSSMRNHFNSLRLSCEGIGRKIDDGQGDEKKNRDQMVQNVKTQIWEASIDKPLSVTGGLDYTNYYIPHYSADHPVSLQKMFMLCHDKSYISLYQVFDTAGKVQLSQYDNEKGRVGAPQSDSYQTPSITRRELQKFSMKTRESRPDLIMYSGYVHVFGRQDCPLTIGAWDSMDWEVKVDIRVGSAPDHPVASLNRRELSVYGYHKSEISKMIYLLAVVPRLHEDLNFAGTADSVSSQSEISRATWDFDRFVDGAVPNTFLKQQLPLIFEPSIRTSLEVIYENNYGIKVNPRGITKEKLHGELQSRITFPTILFPELERVGAIDVPLNDGIKVIFNEIKSTYLVSLFADDVAADTFDILKYKPGVTDPKSFVKFFINKFNEIIDVKSFDFKINRAKSFLKQGIKQAIAEPGTEILWESLSRKSSFLEGSSSMDGDGSTDSGGVIGVNEGIDDEGTRNKGDELENEM